MNNYSSNINNYNYGQLEKKQQTNKKKIARTKANKRASITKINTRTHHHHNENNSSRWFDCYKENNTVKGGTSSFTLSLFHDGAIYKRIDLT